MVDKRAMREEAERLIRRSDGAQPIVVKTGRYPHQRHLRQMRSAKSRLRIERHDPRLIRLQGMRQKQETL